jgi:hypothetical protein
LAVGKKLEANEGKPDARETHIYLATIKTKYDRQGSLLFDHIFD